MAKDAITKEAYPEHQAKVDSMLKEMIDSTQQLDEILQQLQAQARIKDEKSEEIQAFGEEQEQNDRDDGTSEFVDCMDETAEDFPQVNEGPRYTLPSDKPLPELLMVSLWGEHDKVSIAANKNTSIKPNAFRKLRIDTSLPRNRVVLAACSRFHTIFLNDMGLVFAYGHAIDGALGIGPESQGYVEKPTMIDFFFDNLILVQQVACGGDSLVGAHSAAVSQEGGLFTWGVGAALGNGSLQSASIPQRISLPSEDSNPVDEPSPTFAASVSCGSGFCVALSKSGEAFSWGKCSEGRLGLGGIPVIARSSRRRGGGVARKQFQTYQLTPKRVQRIVSATKTGMVHSRANDDAKFLKVSCGDAHCVGITTSGQLATWGRGSSGQLGRGDISDAVTPTRLFPSCDEKSSLQWQDVAAGENWCMALSADGRVWSWGACGGAVLGHGQYSSEKNALLAETVILHHQKLLAQQKNVTAAPNPELPCFKWMTPHPIPCFSTSDIRIRSLSAGTQHAAAISTAGDLYVWGSNYTGVESEGNDLVLTSLPKLVNSGRHLSSKDRDIADIGAYSVEHVVCGGHQVIAFTSGSFLGRSMSQLYLSITQRSVSESDLHSSTGADVVLVVSGHRVFAHKLLLAQRSPVLREMILEEEEQRKQIATNERAELSYLELLLPQLRVDVARAMVEFIYTDSFSLDANPRSSYYLLRDILRASRLFKLPGLKQLCRERLFSVSPSALLGVSDSVTKLEGISEDEALSDNNMEADDSSVNDTDASDVSRSINDDMKFALSDDVWADTVLAAEGRALPVHSCMLISRSEYFRALLGFRRSSAHAGDDDPVIINLEDPYANIVRVLRFIYYDQVSLPVLKHTKVFESAGNHEDNEEEKNVEEEASDQLLEDLVAADKFGLERMKRLCEHAVTITCSNCLEVLAVAELVHAAHLKQVAMRFLQTNLPAITARTEDFSRFQHEFPQLLEELYSSLRDINRDEVSLREWHRAVSKCVAARREEQELQWSKRTSDTSFPWIPLSLTLAFGAMYLTMMHAEEHEYPVVPATNIAAIAAIVGAVLLGWV